MLMDHQHPQHSYVDLYTPQHYSSLLEHQISLTSILYLHKCKSLAAALEAERPSVNPCSKQKQQTKYMVFVVGLHRCFNISI